MSVNRWFVLEHPQLPYRFVVEGPSWGFFFLGTIWALIQGNWGFLFWWIATWIPFGLVAWSEPPQGFLFMVAAVGLLVRWWFTVWFWEKKKQSLLDRGWREKAVLEGPTEEFVRAEWLRGEGRR